MQNPPAMPVTFSALAGIRRDQGNRQEIGKGHMAEGDREAFGRLVRELQGPLFGFLGRMGLSQARGEEIAQETFLRVWQHFSRYRAERGSLTTWTFTIARNLALNSLSRARQVKGKCLSARLFPGSPANSRCRAKLWPCNSSTIVCAGLCSLFRPATGRCWP